MAPHACIENSRPKPVPRGKRRIDVYCPICPGPCAFTNGSPARHMRIVRYGYEYGADDRIPAARKQAKSDQPRLPKTGRPERLMQVVLFFRANETAGGEWLTCRDVAEAMGIVRQQTMSTYLTLLKHKGYLELQGTRGRHRWRLTERGRMARLVEGDLASDKA